MNMHKYSSRARREEKRGGLSTRSAILETAGKVFAERGFAEATSKEICQRAGANSAAVNYYFGGKESLYEHVLIEAHRQMVSLERLDEILASNRPPAEKLRDYLEHMMRTALASSKLWGIKIVLRELASPSPSVAQIMRTAALPKAAKLRSLIREITGLPSGSARLQRAAGVVVMPCMSFILFPETLRSFIFPGYAEDTGAVIDDLLRYAMGGLAALSSDAPILPKK